jgi:hypothetical protein
VGSGGGGGNLLTLAAWVPALLSVVALPFGFIDEEIAVAAGVYGLYVALPGVVAWCLHEVRHRLPRWLQRVIGALTLLVAIPYFVVVFFFTGPLFVIALPAVAVILIVATRLLRARPSGRVSAAA